jgi:hypothetical protein
MWEREIGDATLCVDAYDLDGDGKGEIVVGANDHKLYCFDYQGKERWSVLTPADPYLPEVEPATGPVRVVRCGDINGDNLFAHRPAGPAGLNAGPAGLPMGKKTGKGEIVIGSGNWFAYAYDLSGRKLWGALNWAHQPTSICFVDLGGGRLGAMIGTTYDEANLFNHEGKKVQSVGVGYHGAAMCVAASDMEGKGRMKLFAGSRIGGVHCVERGSDKRWAKFMGAEVSQVATADVNGDGKRELIAGSRNFHLLVTDADGNILWCRNMGEAIRDLVVADVNADGKPEIIVATEGGMVRTVDGQGNILGTFKAGDNVTKVIAADINGDGRPEIVAGADDGFVYGDIR